MQLANKSDSRFTHLPDQQAEDAQHGRPGRQQPAAAAPLLQALLLAQRQAVEVAPGKAVRTCAEVERVGWVGGGGEAVF